MMFYHFNFSNPWSEDGFSFPHFSSISSRFLPGPQCGGLYIVISVLKVPARVPVWKSFTSLVRFRPRDFLLQWFAVCCIEQFAAACAVLWTW